MYKDVVIDLETLSTRSHAVIISIGAVAFNVNEKDTYDDLTDERCFYAVMEREPQVDAGAHIDLDTVSWWFNQSPLARQVLREPMEQPEVALSNFATWCNRFHEDRYLWGNGVGFDNVILENAFIRHNVEFPVGFRKHMDLRTLERIAGYPKDLVEDRGIKHHALDDAKYEALKIQRLHAVIKQAA